MEAFPLAGEGCRAFNQSEGKGEEPKELPGGSDSEATPPGTSRPKVDFFEKRQTEG